MSLAIKQKMISWCQDKDVSFKHLTDYQCRFFTERIIVDIYWKNMRYHIIKHPVLPYGPLERGDIKDINIFFGINVL